MAKHLWTFVWRYIYCVRNVGWWPLGIKRGGASVADKPEITRTSVFDMQTCVPEGWTDEQVGEFANKENPAGTEQGWVVRKSGDEALAGSPERNPCSTRAGFVHIMLDC
jgi:hypothetical protein